MAVIHFSKPVARFAIVYPHPPGEKALTNIKVEGNSYTDGRKIFAEALSPQAVLKLQPIAEASVTRMMGRLEKFAQSGEVGVIPTNGTAFVVVNAGTRQSVLAFCPFVSPFVVNIPADLVFTSLGRT